MPVVDFDPTVVTVGDIVDRVFRDFLETPEEQPTRFALAELLTIDATTLTYDPALLSPEEEDILGPGTLIEIGSEQAVVGGVTPNANALTGLRRGMNGTRAAQAEAGALVTVSPTWTRRSVFEAVADAVWSLYPDLFAVDTQPVAFTSGHVPVDEAVAFPLFAWLGSGSDFNRYPVSFLDEFPGVPSGKAVLLPGYSGSLSGYLVYARRFARPTSEDESLSDLGLQESWGRLVAVSAVAYLLAGREVDAVTQEFLTRQLEQQNFPVGSASRIRDGLVKYNEYLLAKAKKELRARYPVLVTRS